VDALRPPQIADIPPPLPAPAIPPSRATAPNAPTDHLIHKDGEVTTDDGPTINEAGRGTKANPATSEDVLTEQLGRKPRKQEIENYEQQLQLEAAQTGHAPRPKQKAAQQKALPTEHTKNKSRSKADRHFKGRARAKKDAGAEKGDARRRPKIK
jgi:hypothetical protein